MTSLTLSRFGAAAPWIREAVVALLALSFGFGLMPLLIFQAGSTLLGRYDGASPGRLYDSVYRGLELGLASSLVVVFGPYGVYLIFRGLLTWWRVGAQAV